MRLQLGLRVLRRELLLGLEAGLLGALAWEALHGWAHAAAALRDPWVDVLLDLVRLRELLLVVRL